MLNVVVTVVSTIPVPPSSYDSMTIHYPPLPPSSSLSLDHRYDRHNQDTLDDVDVDVVVVVVVDSHGCLQSYNLYGHTPPTKDSIATLR